VNEPPKKLAPSIFNQPKEQVVDKPYSPPKRMRDEILASSKGTEEVVISSSKKQEPPEEQPEPVV
jgi:hypothetical protein